RNAEHPGHEPLCRPRIPLRGAVDDAALGAVTMARARWMRQAMRFGIVGVASNLLLYLVFLALAAGPLGSKSAMTVAYGLALCLTFALNRRWTFGDAGPRGPALVRYLAV